MIDKGEEHTLPLNFLIGGKHVYIKNRTPRRWKT